jgi:hypothetical protein
MKPIWGATLLAGILTTLSSPSADGTLPPLPYHYLHPPPALAAENKPPQSTSRSLSAAVARSASWFVFTSDGQAGINSASGGFVLHPSATGVVVHIQPVETPSGLPAGLAVDGNAYSISATERLANGLAQLGQDVRVTLRWPHIPSDIYLYQDGRWRRLCSSVHATLSSTTISCPTSRLGIFAAVGLAAVIGSPPFPTTPVNTVNRFSRYIPLAAALVVVVIAAVLAYLVSRPDEGSSSRSRDR